MFLRTALTEERIAVLERKMARVIEYLDLEIEDETASGSLVDVSQPRIKQPPPAPTVEVIDAKKPVRKKRA